MPGLRSINLKTLVAAPRAAAKPSMCGTQNVMDCDAMYILNIIYKIQSRIKNIFPMVNLPGSFRKVSYSKNVTNDIVLEIGGFVHVLYDESYAIR